MFGILAGIDARPDTFRPVVSDHGYSLGVVRPQSLLKSLSVVIASLNEWFSSDVVSHRCLWWVEDFVVGSARSRVNQSTGDTGYQKAVVDLKLDGVLERLAFGLEH